LDYLIDFELHKHLKLHLLTAISSAKYELAYFT
jgi:hypothetical protein